MQNPDMTFWEHLEILRISLVKIVIVTFVCTLVAFCFKNEMFEVILAPKNDTFVTYRLINEIGQFVRLPLMPSFSVKLINTELSEQFIVHMKAALYVGAFCALPYILCLLFRFVSPALYTCERKYTLWMMGGGYVMFVLGVTVCYFLIFPFTFRFLGTYQVSDEVENMITLQSYMSTFMMMLLTIGTVFEIPVLSWILAKLGILSADYMKIYRKHAFVIVLMIAAVITPTSDIFTLLLVAFPMYLLYEISIRIVKHINDCE